MEVPSDFDGKIKDIKVKEGDSVREGTGFRCYRGRRE